ncbi:hypothetical protein ACET3Z_004914 [Daucus carota]
MATSIRKSGKLVTRTLLENPNASKYQNKSIHNWDDICTLFASDRATGEGAEQYEESAAAMEMENELGSGGAGSEVASGESNKKVKRDRLADAVTKFAKSLFVILNEIKYLSHVSPTSKYYLYKY